MGRFASYAAAALLPLITCLLAAGPASAEPPARHPLGSGGAGVDHLPLRNSGGVACINLIDFNYRPGHTEEDPPRRCSSESLAKVGWGVWEWLVEVDRDCAGDKP